jgi:hypothetical protein
MRSRDEWPLCARFFVPNGGPVSRRPAAGKPINLMNRRSGRLRLALDFGCRVDPGAWGVAPPPRLKVDFVVNPAFFIKTLQIRQQGRLRELHRFWCWPQRSSHGQDQLGYRPCTLTRGPAPKSTTTLILYRSILPLILSPEIARRSSQKKYFVATLPGSEPPH